jgi:hypothetical protein
VSLAKQVKSIKTFFLELLYRVRKRTEDPDDIGSADYQTARMSHNRLQALEGQGYRQCYLEKLREVSDANVTESKERWFGEGAAETPPITAQSEAEKRKLKLAQAQHRMSHTRLQALVQTMSAEQLILNEEEARRLGGPGLDFSITAEENGTETGKAR